jgi:bacteriocin biosynthesis cyclodehydratase domain-containing protein
VTVSKDSTENAPPRLSGEKSWLVNSDARVLTSGDEVLIRQGGLVRRCVGQGVRNFVTALLGKAENGRIDLDPSVVDAARRPRLDWVFDQLVDAGLLIELTESDCGGELASVTFGLWRRAGGTIDRTEIAERLRTRTVNIVGSGALAERLRTCCHEVGLQLMDLHYDSDATSSVTVVVGGYEEDPVLEEWNKRALAAGPDHPWLAVIPYDGEHATVGPWMVPGESACYRCYRLRRASVFPDESVSVTLAGATAADLSLDRSSRYPGLNLMQVGLIVDHLVEHIGLERQAWQSLPGGLTTIAIGPRGIETDRHRVLRVPRCPQCSPMSGRGYPQVWFSQSVGTPTSSEPPKGKVRA